MMPIDSDTFRDVYIVGLRNAHAVEKQALSIMTPQVERLVNYPEVEERLRAHIEETHAQIVRLDEVLDHFDTSASSLKDAALSLTGGMAAITHSAADDEILKNSFANYAFEHFEIAAYRSLLTLSDDAGFAAGQILRQSLEEEERMAAWIGETLPVVTRRYADLYAAEGASAAKV
jgi:ferritin-like metal-binding protein YciE